MECIIQWDERPYRFNEKPEIGHYQSKTPKIVEVYPHYLQVD
jgi:hypothetical protein